MNTTSCLTGLMLMVSVSGGMAACSHGDAPALGSTSSFENPMTPGASEKSPISAREDFYLHVNGAWLEATAIPEDESGWDPFTELQARTRMQLQGLIEGLGSRPSNREAQQIVALYSSFMDVARVDAAEATPLAAEWSRIDALTDKRQIPALIAHLDEIGVSVPHEMRIQQDARDPTRYVVNIQQAGLGLPDRDYYLSADSRLTEACERYRAHVTRMMAMAGASENSGDAILSIETALARHQWTATENRDPIKTYNPYPVPDLSRLTGTYDWQSYLSAAGIGNKANYLVLSQPGYLVAYARLVESESLAAWKDYFKWRVLSEAAPYLSSPIAGQQFAFYGTYLLGIPAHAPRSQRAVTLVNEIMGDALAQLYIKQYLPPQAKDDIDAMVQVVLAAYRTRIKTLDWMSAPTQKAAQQKINALIVKIGNPIKYRDYGKLEIQNDDLYGNYTRGHSFEFRRQVAKLGQPIARDEWKTLPQSVTSYYDPQLNEVAFSAALLQAPFFDRRADPALNYGAMGVIIARTIAHAFDDVGSEYAADGRLSNWLAGQDHDRFRAREQALVVQTDAHVQGAGSHPSGAASLGETLPGLAGVPLAYQAYHLALAGKDAPLAGGLTGDQRYFMSFSRMSRSKMRAEASEEAIWSTRRPPGAVLVELALMNQESFVAAFGLESGDKMHLDSGSRVSLW